MTIAHKELAAGRWRELSTVEQMANVGGEVERLLNWRGKGDLEHSARAFERALELMDLTMDDPKNLPRLREIARAREILADYAAGDNVYRSTDESLKRYYSQFAFAARRTR